MFRAGPWEPVAHVGGRQWPPVRGRDTVWLLPGQVLEGSANSPAVFCEVVLR